MTQAPKQQTQWLSPDSVPKSLATKNFLFEPLHEKHAELDFKALMSCRARLRSELQWGEWPREDFSLEQNRVDLCDHYGEFTRGEAFAFTVLSPDRDQCLGCIYIERCDEINGAQLAFWVIDSAIPSEATLVADTLNWIHDKWQIERVLLPLRPANTRGISLAEEIGLQLTTVAAGSALADRCCFLWDSSELA